MGLAWLGSGLAMADGFDPFTENLLPELRDLAFSPSEGFQMTLHAAPGSYGIEFSTDLLSWHPHGNLADWSEEFFSKTVLSSMTPAST